MSILQVLLNILYPIINMYTNLSFYQANILLNPAFVQEN